MLLRCSCLLLFEPSAVVLMPNSLVVIVHRHRQGLQSSISFRALLTTIEGQHNKVQSQSVSFVELTTIVALHTCS